MHWLPITILAGGVLCLQVALAPHLEVFGERPDWLLVLVVFLALYGRAKDAIVTSFLIGLAADLMSLERLGLLACSYTLVAVMVVSVRAYLFTHRATTHFALTLAVAIPIRMGWAVYQTLFYGGPASWVGGIALSLLWGAVFTAAWAPLLHGGLLSVGKLLGLSRPRYSHQGLSKIVGTGV